MELKEFIKKAMLDIVCAVDESSTESSRELSLRSTDKDRTIEFDVAVSVEESKATGGKAGIKVLQFAEAGGGIDNITKNSTVSRIRFGVSVAYWKRGEQPKASSVRKESYI